MWMKTMTWPIRLFDARLEEQANACMYVAVAMEVDERMRVCVQPEADGLMLEPDVFPGKRFQSYCTNTS